MIMVIYSLIALTGCSNSTTPQYVNELRFSLNEITDIKISYDEENITFYESEVDDLVIKEYMTKDKSSYYATVTEHDGSIEISEGNKPFFKVFLRYVEVYLPISYNKNLTVTSTNGNIDFADVSLNLSALRVDNSSGDITLDYAKATNIYLSSSSGTLNLGNIQGDIIKLDTTSGSVICIELNGNVTYTSTSGDIKVMAAIGSGSYITSNSGILNVEYTEVTGDLSFYNKNDNIMLTLPDNLDFYFEATTKNGAVSTSFQQSMTVNERTTSGIVGNNPTVSIHVETNNGDIEVEQ